MNRILPLFLLLLFATSCVTKKVNVIDTLSIYFVYLTKFITKKSNYYEKNYKIIDL